MSSTPEVVIPTKLEARDQLAAAYSVMRGYGERGLLKDPEAEIDWATYFEEAQKRLGLSGSGQRSGTLVLTDWYPLRRTLHIESHVELRGAFRAKHHLGSSCGFRAEEGFEGDWVLDWGKPGKKVNYSNFGAGIRGLHIASREGVNGVSFRGAQQSAGVENLVVRGYGNDAIGVRLGGDTYSVRDVFSDAAIGGEGSFVRKGAVGYELGESRVYSLRLENLTSHNCEIGLRWGDAHQVAIENFETELTDCPLVCTYDARGINIRNACFRHTKKVLELEKIRWPKEARIKLDGMMSDGVLGVVILPGGEEVSISRNFDIVIEGDGSGVGVVDLKEKRSCSLSCSEE